MVKAIIKDENGDDQEVEVATQEEVATQIKAKEDEFAGKLKEKDDVATKLATEKADLEKKIKDAELAGIKEDHPNFKILKEALGKKDEEIKTITKTIEDEKTSRKQEAMNADIKIASKGNTEFEKKVRLHLEKTLTALPENTAEERKIKLDAAVKLSADHSTDGPGMFDGGTGGSGMGNGNFNPSGGETKVEFDSRQKSLGNKLGISDADFKKYGNDPRLIAMQKGNK